MTIEEYIIGYLSATLGVTAVRQVDVSGSVPHPMPEEFVTVEKTGESTVNMIPTAKLSVRSWSSSPAAASDLDRRVCAAMLSAISEPEISHSVAVTSYNDPDEETHRARYTSTYEVVYLF